MAQCRLNSIKNTSLFFLLNWSCIVTGHSQEIMSKQRKYIHVGEGFIIDCELQKMIGLLVFFFFTLRERLF